jgi:uncharacterized protein YkwD
LCYDSAKLPTALFKIFAQKMRFWLRLIPVALLLLATLLSGCAENGDEAEVIADAQDQLDTAGRDDAIGDSGDPGDSTPDSVELSDGEDTGDTEEMSDLPEDNTDDADASSNDTEDTIEDTTDVTEIMDSGGEAEDTVDDSTSDSADSEDVAEDVEDDGGGTGGGGLSDGEQLLLDAHNATRTGTLNPPPSPGLSKVTWDSRLATVAQNYAERCEWSHNGAASQQYAEEGGSGYVGENLSAAWGNETINLGNMYSGWSEEAGFYDYDANSCQAGEQCGHYTQVVWRETERVGCGWTQCSTLQGINGPTDVWFLVCNYAPGGNINGRRPY